MPILDDEISAIKILSMYKNAINHQLDPCKKEVTVSFNKHSNQFKVIDGHHHSIACLLLDGKQNVTIIYDSFDHIFQELKHFKGVTYKSSRFFKLQQHDVVLSEQDLGKKIILD
jgi:hypothetical protein